MTETAHSETALFSSLQDIRLPDHAAGGVVADIALAVGMGGLSALILVVFLRLLSLRQMVDAEPTLSDRVKALSNENADTRRVALLHLLRRHAPERFAQLQAELYRPGSQIDLHSLEAELAHLD